jgi:hypothetical protein
MSATKHEGNDMHEKAEKLRAGIALVSAAVTMLEQAGSEFGGEAENSVSVLLGQAIEAANHCTVRAARQYDRLKSV